MVVIRSPMNDCHIPSIDTDFLAHHGVKGMKWGVRKKPVRSSSTTTKKKKKSIFAERKERKQKLKKAKQLAIAREKKQKLESKKKISQMTDAELLKRRERLRLEKEVKTLTQENESAAKRIARKAITKAGEKVVEEIVHDTAKFIIGQKLINDKAGVNIVNLNLKEDKDDKKKKDKD